MLSIWRIAPAACSFLVALTWSLYTFSLLEFSEIQAAENLGLREQSVRVIAAPADGRLDAGPATASLVEFAKDHDVSIAFSRSYATGLVSIFDEHDRFVAGGVALAELLGPAGSGPTAAISDSSPASPVTLSLPGRLDGLTATEPRSAEQFCRCV